MIVFKPLLLVGWWTNTHSYSTYAIGETSEYVYIENKYNYLARNRFFFG